MNIVAVIPARGGSKRIPRKNVREFAGKPMIAWSIEALLSSQVFDDVIVSTDDDEVAEISRQYGARVPFVRPAELSDDTTGITPVLRHAITILRESGSSPSFLTCAYATAPFLRARDLRAAYEQLRERTDADYSLAVTSFPAPVQRAIACDENGFLEFLWPEFAQARSQDSRESFHDAGHFFMGRVEAFLKYPTTLSGKTLPYAIPRMLCQDIDTPEDWDHALALFEYLQNAKGVLS